MDIIRAIAEEFKKSKHAVAFTGAGISSESGIPTYRGEGGLWNKYDPNKYASIRHFLEDPSYYWNFFLEVRYPQLKEVMPNNAHLALADLEAQRLSFANPTRSPSFFSGLNICDSAAPIQMRSFPTSPGEHQHTVQQDIPRHHALVQVVPKAPQYAEPLRPGEPIILPMYPLIGGDGGTLEQVLSEIWAPSPACP